MSALSQFAGGGLKSVQHVAGTNGAWPAGGQGNGGSPKYLDVVINAVDLNKAYVMGVKTIVWNGAHSGVGYRLIAANVVRCETSSNNATNPNYYEFVVVESR